MATMRPEAGFTLIELILVIALISSLGMLTTAFTARFLTQNAVQNTQDQIVGDFRKAQFYAMMGKQNSAWGVKLDNTAHTITLYEGTSYASTPFNETFTINPTITLSSSGATDISFARKTGLPNIASTLTFTITGSASHTTKTVTMNTQGMVSR